MNTRIIAVWICPTPDCDNYFGSKSTGDLKLLWNHDLKFRPTYTRDLCPNCLDSGMEVRRELRFAVVLDFGPDEIGQKVPNEDALVQEAFRALKEAGHESVS